jgi:hypothetical protein
MFCGELRFNLLLLFLKFILIGFWNLFLFIYGLFSQHNFFILFLCFLIGLLIILTFTLLCHLIINLLITIILGTIWPLFLYLLLSCEARIPKISPKYRIRHLFNTFSHSWCPSGCMINLLTNLLLFISKLQIYWPPCLWLARIQLSLLSLSTLV